MITIREISMTKEVLEEIRKLDLEAYPNAPGLDWYLARYKPRHSSFAALDGERIVGYIAVLPARKELYDAVLNGVLVDDIGINPAMFPEESGYYYAGSVVVDPRYRGQQIGSRLLDRFTERYGDRKVCLIAVSEGVRRLAERYFTHVKRIVENADVFVSRNRSEGGCP